MDPSLGQRMASRTDRELLEVLAKPEEYLPEAVAAAQAEIEKRGGEGKMRAGMDAEPAPETTGSAAPKTGGRKLRMPILAAVAAVAAASSLFHLAEDGRNAPKARMEKELAALLEDARAKTPLAIGEDIRLDSVSYSDHCLSFRMTMLTLEAGKVDCEQFRKEAYAGNCQKAHGDPQFQRFWKIDPEFLVAQSFFTRDGALICSFTIPAPGKAGNAIPPTAQ